MSQLSAYNLSMSLDGFMAGPDQTLDDPLGTGAMRLHDWVFPTHTHRAAQGLSGGTHGVDDSFVQRGTTGIGATIMGRNMFGPVRGDWDQWAEDHDGEPWTGWWGETPPFHHPVFVLTHHPRPPLPMDGGTTFHFVYGGVEDAYAQATDAAGDLNIRLGGGASTVRQFMAAGLVDEIHVAVVPILLGRGERLFGELDDGADDFVCVEMTQSPAVSHIRLARRR